MAKIISEPKIENQLLEDAANNWIDNNFGPSSIIKSKNIKDAYRAGVQWQKEQSWTDVEVIEFTKDFTTLPYESIKFLLDIRKQSKNK